MLSRPLRHPSTMAAFPQFQLLAPELQAEVSSFLPVQDLLSFNRTSKRIHALTIPNLFRRVDLDLVVYEPATDAWPYQTDNALELRGTQRRLIRAVAAHPEYANYIHDLSWHVFLPEDCAPPPAPISPPATWPDHLYPGLEKAIALAPTSFTQRSSHETSTSPLEFFQRLEMAQRVRLNFSRGDMFQELPAFLFPRAHSIALAGLATERLACSVLHSLGRLRELVLDHIHSPEPDFVLRLLEHLTGHCDSLQHLALRKGGNSRADEPFDLLAEERTLVQFGHLANSCRATLQHLALGLTPIVHGIVFFGADNRLCHVREWFLPVVFNPELGAWPQLCEFSMEGIALESSDVARVQLNSPRVHITYCLDAEAALEEHAPVVAETPPKINR
ncbi:hypothetical protein EXIGLDRAFT_777680 [Exidia glandulosa HHB12029]|uniref:F-box domain-containing protein n=1 Tax=Exidia glandulosa HHB12029 TaxID=1314781 RepID=A0A165CX58_EXIGL|nr:hypothetical protein EXIGLDRAFT_777680 [Exidia glandulosa HHB12029]